MSKSELRRLSLQVPEIKDLVERKEMLEADCAAGRDLINGVMQFVENSALEQMECRGDEDCDHCLGIQYVDDMKKFIASPNPGKEMADKLKMLEEEITGLDFHGCLTGDCPHEKQADCMHSLRAAITDLAALKDGKG